jgi:hypothetical protein
MRCTTSSKRRSTRCDRQANTGLKWPLKRRSVCYPVRPCQWFPEHIRDGLLVAPGAAERTRGDSSIRLRCGSLRHHQPQPDNLPPGLYYCNIHALDSGHNKTLCTMMECHCQCNALSLKIACALSAGVQRATSLPHWNIFVPGDCDKAVTHSHRITDRAGASDASGAPRRSRG